MTSTPTHIVDVLLILVRGDELLLACRDGTGYADGMWNLPSGKLEYGEDAFSAVAREATEEVGVKLDVDELRMVAAVHHRNPYGDARLGLVFAADHDEVRHGWPANAEPCKCSAIGWFRHDNLPERTYSYTTACIAAWRSGAALQLDGWR